MDDNAIRTAARTAHAAPIDELIQILETDLQRGLQREYLNSRQTAFGLNQLAEAPAPSRWRKLLGQFQDLVIWILIVAAVVSGFLNEWVDALAIVAIVILNGVIGFMQEERAERALAALQKLSAPLAKTRRDGELASIPANELVPGDIIELEAGDNIPADARFVQGFNLMVQEAALTGESVPVEKDAALVLAPDTSLGDRRNMAYLGTIVAAGKGTAVVTATGMETELGHIAGLLERHPREATPLQRRLAELGRILVVVCLAIVAVIFILQVVRKGDWIEAFLTGVSLAVAAVPEGLPAVVTIALALGVQRMVRRNALVRKLPSVETLGSVTVICTDKTGTLTRNEMTVQEMAVGTARYRVSGVGYVPHGQFFEVQNPKENAHDAKEVPITAAQNPDLQMALTVCAWCNNSELVPAEREPGWQVIGDPTEGALLVAARKAGVDISRRSKTTLFEIPFDSTRKAMSVVVRGDDGVPVLYSKGAPEVILQKCVSEQRQGRIEPLGEERQREILKLNADMAARALRVLAFGYRLNPPRAEDSEAESELVFAGLAGMIDPPREEAKIAVEKCRAAGIRPVMITGDHPATALAVARALGLADHDGCALAGPELDRLSDDGLAEQVERIVVYARATAEHKLRIVNAWKKRGHVVAMTGDGVNDAPAIKAADIGIAMGITGTDVTKEASDMVLTDDNFASIVNAVEEGRGIYDNIQKVLQFLLSCNFGEILLMLVATLLGWPIPLLPIQLLWINLVTDGFPALALSVEPPERDVMERRPRRPHESILSLRLGFVIFYQGLLDGLVALTAFGYIYLRDPSQVSEARGLAFCVVVYTELFRSLGARSPTRTLFQLGLFTNPYLILAICVSGLLQLAVVSFPFTRTVFSISSHSWVDLAVMLLLALTPISVIETAKLLWWKFGNKSRADLETRPVVK